jgi:hypothetical protein
MRDEDAAVRYWAVVGLRAGAEGGAEVRGAFAKALGDVSVAVRIEAAGALLDGREDRNAIGVLEAALEGEQDDAAVHAARTLELLGQKARPALGGMRRELAAASDKPSRRPPGVAMYLRFALAPAVEAMEAEAK